MAFPKLDNFHIHARIAKNPLYTLYEATDKAAQERILLKLLNKKVSEDKRAVLKTFMSARILSAHPCSCITQLHRCGRDRQHYYLATEHLDSEEWSSLAEAKVSLTYAQFLEVMTKAALSLRHAHMLGVVHGFLHPGCIYIASDLSVRIDGFGFHPVLAEYLSRTSEIESNIRRCLSPEVIKRETELDGRADMFSLGMILFQVISGQLSITRDDFLSNKEHGMFVSAAENLFSRTISRNPENRFDNFRLFITELKRINHELLLPVDAIEEAEKDLSSDHPHLQNKRFRATSRASFLPIFNRLFKFGT